MAKTKMRAVEAEQTDNKNNTWPAFTCSKSTIETLEKCVKSVQSKQ